MKRVICVSGKANSGKDTTIDYMMKYLRKHNYKVCKMAFAKYLKDICKTHMHWDGEKDEAGREILQVIGTNKIRDELGWHEFHCGRVCEDIKIVEDLYDFIFISDSRFENELYYTHSKFPGRFEDILIVNPNLDSNLTNEQLSHKSENALGDYEFQYTINNEFSLNHLEYEAKRYCENILLK